MNKLPGSGGVTLLAVACLTIMVGCVIVPGLPRIAPQMGVADASGWLVTLPALGLVICGPLAGRIIDTIGMYRSLCTGLLLYGLLGAGGVFMHGHIFLFADRLLLGGATALVMVSGTGLISHFYEGRQRLQMIAWQGMSIEAGGVLFLFAGGLLAGVSWAWPFALYLFAWVLLAMVLLFIPHTGVQHREPQQAGRYKAPLPVKFTWAAALGSMIIFFTAVILLPQYLGHFGAGSSRTGLFLSFISMVAVVAAWQMPRCVERFSGAGTLALAFALYAAGQIWFAFAPSFYLMLPGAVLLGCGFGFSVPLVNHLIVELSEPMRRGHNLARLSMAIFSGQFLSSFMDYLPGDATVAFSLAAALGLAFSISIWLWRHNLLPAPALQASVSEQ